jgi:uncharacterized damage-inducible protein DinB
MNKNYFTELADYNCWVNSIIINWLDQIDDRQWEQVIVSSFSSISATAIHIASAQKIWNDYWQNAPDPIFLSAEFKGTKNELITILGKASADLKRFIDQYPAENYLKEIVFKWPGGQEGRMAFWQTFSHMINHSSYHRGQLVTLLRQAGFTKFTSTDLATYYRVHQK